MVMARTSVLDSRRHLQSRVADKARQGDRSKKTEDQYCQKNPRETEKRREKSCSAYSRGGKEKGVIRVRRPKEGVHAAPEETGDMRQGRAWV
jgi:hypothetical protein